MGLEALYLQKKEEGTLTRRLGQRVGKIMSFFDKPPIKVKGIIGDAYEIRSAVVHGSKLKEESRQPILEDVIEYLQLSIITFLEMNEEKSKSDFLSLIDHSLLEKKAHEKLKELKEGCTTWNFLEKARRKRKRE